jgi:hypothetical protein
MILEEKNSDTDTEWSLDMAEFEGPEAEIERDDSSEIALVMGDFADCDNWSLDDFSDLINGIA